MTAADTVRRRRALDALDDLLESRVPRADAMHARRCVRERTGLSRLRVARMARLSPRVVERFEWGQEVPVECVDIIVRWWSWLASSPELDTWL